MAHRFALRLTASTYLSKELWRLALFLANAVLSVGELLTGHCHGSLPVMVICDVVWRDVCERGVKRKAEEDDRQVVSRGDDRFGPH